MKLYELPERLGGGIVECEEYEKDGNNWVWFSVGDWMYHCRADALTEVRPAVPEEPPHDSVLVDRFGGVWLYGSHGWFGARRNGPAEFITWAELHGDRGPLTQLVPDPVESAPELPYNSDGATVEVKRLSSTDDLPVWLFVPSTWRTPEQAEEIAAAILRAAREARAAS